MNYLDKYHFWIKGQFFDENTKKELKSLSEKEDIKEIEDRFYKDLEFGTAGLRGVMSAGTNRINKYTTGRATLGYSNYLLNSYGKIACLYRGVVISYDTRNNSFDLALSVAKVFSGQNIKVYLFSNPSPIPELSFAIRKFGAVGGVMITASHNTKQYNGYKVYDENGCQLNVKVSNIVTKYISRINGYDEIDFSGNDDLIETIEITDEFVLKILEQSRFFDEDAKSKLKIVYTPIHGTGLVPIKAVLEKSGFKNLNILKSQSEPDGDFPTVTSPNPEDRQALELALMEAIKTKADIIIGTDPDADRVGVAVRHNSEYVFLTGNEVGILLVDYVLNNTDLSKMKNPTIVKSIVTSNLCAKIAEKKGVKTIQTLTGFKFIGEKITEFYRAKKLGDELRDYDFLIGLEESCGYLIGTHARDKDAVVSSLLISEMASKLKLENKDLVFRLEEIYSEYGYYYSCQESFYYNGIENKGKIEAIMSELRKTGSPISNIKRIIDYSKPTKAEKGFGYYPLSNVLFYELLDESWVALRPSGTEPKIKIYYNIVAENKQSALQKLDKIKTELRKFI